jgi:hypothetical protein
MKVKLNLSGEGIKQFFLVNGEKIVLGGVVIALLGFLYSAITAKPLDETKSPEVIKRESAVLMNRINDPASNPPAGDRPKLPEPAPPVPPQPLKWQTEISPLIFPELKKRSDPTILPIEEMQIASGVAIVGYAPALASGAAGGMSPAAGALAAGNDHGPAYGGVGAAAAKSNTPAQTDERFNPQGMMGAAKPGDEPRAKTYAIITGLVPWSKQCEEYSNRFEFAVPPSLPASDPTQPTANTALQTGQPQLPEYIYFRVQRTDNLQPKDDKDWTTTINYLSALTDQAAWSNQSGVQDIVDQNYIFQPGTLKGHTTYITWPLPPLFLKIWGFEASHPKVKLNLPQDAMNPGQQQGPDLAQGDFDGTQGGARAAAPPVARPAAGAFGPGGAGMASGRDHDYNPGGGRFGGGVFGQPAPAAVTTPDNTVVVDNKLFRFVDFTAEPGKTYRYRIQLVVNNPNFGLLPDCLLDAKTASVPTLFSDWAMTAPVTIPRDWRLLADSVSVTVPGKSEPKAKLAVLAIVKAKPATEGVSTPLTSDVPLEALKELFGTNEAIPMGAIVDLHLAFDKVVDVPEGGLYRKVENVNIDTDQTMLLDLRNDDPLAMNPKSKGPTEMLFMDSSGRLVTADSAADSLVVKDFRDRTTVPQINVMPAPEPVPQPKGTKGSVYTPADKKGTK